ncbi:MAG: signal recognition particle-docking protein FtsY, partial [Desulfobacterales bacterium PC51MH44]
MTFTWFKKKESKQEGKTLPETGESTAAFQAKDEAQDEAPAKNANILTAESEKEISEPSSSAKQETFQTGTAESSGFLKRLKNGLSKTRKLLSTDINELFTGKRKIDDELLEELEELLITADIGVQISMDLIQSISKKSSEISDADQLKEALKEKILSLLNTEMPTPQKIMTKPHVIMVIGVNGVGKTTTIGKLAAKSVSAGEKVLIAAADTFRAAAIEQLAIWAQRAGVEIVKHKEMSDPAAVAYDGIEAAVARGADVVLVDTAGRLHTRINLMEE